MGGILGKSIARKRLASPWNLGTPEATWAGVQVAVFPCLS